MANEYMHVVMNLLLVLTIMLVLMFVLKKIKFGKHTWNRHIKIINMVSIGTKEKLMLVEVNNKYLLLGATPTHIEKLHVFDELVEAVEERSREKKNFLEMFNQQRRRPAACPRDPE